MADPTVTGDLARAQGLAEAIRDHQTYSDTDEGVTGVAAQIVRLIEGARAGLSNPVRGSAGG